MFEELTPHPNPDPPADSDLAAWKEALRRDFEQWLAQLDAIPEPDETGEFDPVEEAPDLYSFYEQLTAANAENRKANRRTVEAFSQWGETLGRFEASLGPLRETLGQWAAAQARGGETLSRTQCLMLVEFFDRLERIGKAFATPPSPRGWWSNDAAWRKAWTRQQEAFDILAGHLETWLKKEGVSRLETMGKPFDPAVMVAVAAEPDAAHPPHTVLEELAAGYRRQGELLRPAQVKVSRPPQT